MSTRKKIRVVTETEHPLESPDYIDPDGCVNDNNSNPQFLSEIDEFVDYDEYSLLDLGCAGGQFVVDVYNKGFVSVGLEGGNETEILSRGAGSHNWQKFKNECLFFADISQPFDILDEDGNTVKFDFITGWDFFEHPDCSEIPGVIKNIKKHLKDDGMVLGTINPSEGWKHRCAKDKDWWDDTFTELGFAVDIYPFSCSPRPVGLGGQGYAACFKLKTKR